MHKTLTPSEFQEHIDRIDGLQVVRRTKTYKRNGYDVAEIWATAMPASTRAKLNDRGFKLTGFSIESLHSEPVLKMELKRK